MSLSVLAVVIDCLDPARQAAFWSQALGYDTVERNPGEYLVSDPAGIGGVLYFMAVPEPQVGKNRLHLDVDDNPDTFTVMHDPEGAVFCVTSWSTLTGVDPTPGRPVAPNS